MPLQCPCSLSPIVASFHHVMKVGAAIATMGSVERGVSTTLAAGQTGTAIGAFADPVGITFGSVSGTILGGIAKGVGGAHSALNVANRSTARFWRTTSACFCGHRFNLPA